MAHSIGALACARAMAAGGLVARRVVCLAPAVNRASLVDGFAGLLRLPGPVLADLSERVDRFTGGRQFWTEGIITSPTLVVHDPEDSYAPWSEVQALETRWPRVQLRSTGRGHSGMLTDPDVIRAAVGFIADG